MREAILGSVFENLQAVMHHHGDEQEEFDGEGNRIEIISETRLAPDFAESG